MVTRNHLATIFPKFCLSQSDRYEVDQLQSLRNSVRMELQDLEMQLEERLLGLDEQLRAVRGPSPFRSSVLPVCCGGPGSEVEFFIMCALGQGTYLTICFNGFRTMHDIHIAFILLTGDLIFNFALITFILYTLVLCTKYDVYIQYI